MLSDMFCLNINIVKKLASEVDTLMGVHGTKILSESTWAWLSCVMNLDTHYSSRENGCIQFADPLDQTDPLRVSWMLWNHTYLSYA